MKLIAAYADTTSDSDDVSPSHVRLANDADPYQLALAGVQRIDLHFPKFSDGRAFSQAFVLRRRLGFKGELRATGDVLVDQLPHMQRSGFDLAVLRADQDMAVAKRVLAAYPGHDIGHYQGDALDTRPHFIDARQA
ncbi:hypothetical protein AwPolaro_11340 [Polaromonas sp.]|nr:hypothetical protein AwPolaro_11340 [Polaromonas sp.]